MRALYALYVTSYNEKPIDLRCFTIYVLGALSSAVETQRVNLSMSLCLYGFHTGQEYFKVTEPLKNMQSLLILRDIPLHSSSKKKQCGISLTRNFGDVIPPLQVLTDADSQVRWICYLSECDPFELVVWCYLFSPGSLHSEDRTFGWVEFHPPNVCPALQLC